MHFGKFVISRRRTTDLAVALTVAILGLCGTVRVEVHLFEVHCAPQAK
jgi:hypothetical protein